MPSSRLRLSNILHVNIYVDLWTTYGKFTARAIIIKPNLQNEMDFDYLGVSLLPRSPPCSYLFPLAKNIPPADLVDNRFFQFPHRRNKIVVIFLAWHGQTCSISLRQPCWSQSVSNHHKIANNFLFYSIKDRNLLLCSIIRLGISEVDAVEALDFMLDFCASDTRSMRSVIHTFMWDYPV